MPRRSRTRGGLPEWLSQTVQPVFVIDSRRVVLYFNRGCESLTGWNASDLIGQIAVWASTGDATVSATLLSALVPPVALEPTTHRVHLLTRDGQSLDRVIHFFPLAAIELDSTLDAEPQRWMGLIVPPPPPQKLLPVATESQLHAELSALKADLRRRYQLSQVVAQCSSMRRVMIQVQLAVSCHAPLAFCGLPGTGKEHLARAVHAAGEHRVRTFVPVDCRQSPRLLDELLDSLLAPEREEPPIPVLRRGAVLLQHADHLPRDWQRRMTEEVDLTAGSGAVRWMIAVSSPLDLLVQSGELLPEFCDRFGVLEIHLPKLGDRPGEFPLLVQQAIEVANTTGDPQITGLSPDVWQQFAAYNWPGQLDELFAVIQEAHAASAGPLITVRDLPFRFRAGQDAQTIGPAEVGLLAPLEETLARVEREQIQRALEQSGGNKSVAADLLGIPRPKLYRRLESLGLLDDGNGL
ncbi:MAG: PAS domain-containing protein [Planctomycetota bacterium]|nr:MAG: PAS domain-containing protein [Planctomycetota bacterium]